MKLHTYGRPDAPAVLLLPGREKTAAELVRQLRPLEKRYRLLAVEGDASVQELEKALLHARGERLWGAYGLREGGTLLLALLAGGRVQIRTAITEGPFALASRSLRHSRSRIVCWKGGRDRKAKRAWKALKADVPGLRSLTLGRLKAGQDYVSLRPDLMIKRLESTFGTACTVRLTETLPRRPETVWRQLRRRPAGRAVLRLTEMAPLVHDDADHIQLLEGKTKRLPLWSHMVRLEPLGDDRTVCIDQVELEAGGLTPAARVLAGLYLRREQRRRRAMLRREK